LLGDNVCRINKTTVSNIKIFLQINPTIVIIPYDYMVI